jgi:acyl-CoA synthetase (AMP-forming)/AMP-acid ligase II
LLPRFVWCRCTRAKNHVWKYFAGCERTVDRKIDLISISGVKVFPNELEEVADLHPGVLKPGKNFGAELIVTLLP